MDLISPFLNGKKTAISSDKKAQSVLSATAKKRLIKEAKALELADEEIDLFIGSVESLKKKINPETLEAYLVFMETLKPKNRILAAKEVGQLLDERAESKLVKKFLKIQKSVDKKYNKELKKITKNLKKEKSGISDSELNRLAAKQAKEFRGKYEKLAYGCKSKKMTPERKAAGKSFSKFIVGIGIASSVGAYSYQNWDKEKDGIWFGRLGYELTIGTLVGMLSSKIISNPADSALKKGFKKWLLTRTTGLVDMGLYGMLFGASQEEARARLDEIVKDPSKKEEIQNLIKALDDKRIYQRLKEDLMDNLTPFAGMFGIDIPPSATEHIKDVDWNNLTAEDLEREDVQEVLMVAILIQSYEDEKGEFVQTGHVGADRYAFHGAYGAVMTPKNIAVSLYIYNILCTGALNPKAALAKAIGVYTVDRLIFDQLYYFVRRMSINQ